MNQLCDVADTPLDMPTDGAHIMAEKHTRFKRVTSRPRTASIKKLKGQLQDRPLRNDSPENAVNEEMENGTDQQRDSSRQISDLKFKLTKSTQEITALEQNIIRLESQVTRYKSSSENAEKVEDELKAEKRKLQREVSLLTRPEPNTHTGDHEKVLPELGTLMKAINIDLTPLRLASLLGSGAPVGTFIFARELSRPVNVTCKGDLDSALYSRQVTTGALQPVIM
ncbi:hypothetical protein FKM82_021448 [Ascaphus truei]